MKKRKTVLITGAGSGIGLALVKKFLSAGWKVHAHYRRTVHELKILQERVGAGDLKLLKGDFKKTGDFRKFLKNVRHIPVDALVNNAGDYDTSYKSGNRVADIQKTFLVNTIVPALVSEQILAAMRKNGKGSIVNISSIGAKYGSGITSMFYGASKRGLEAITKTLAREGAPDNILVNAVRPGLTNTEFLRRISKNIKERKKMIPLKRLAEPQEIADFVFYLCANNSYITGEILTIAGGE